MRLHRFVGPDLGRIFRGETVSGLSEWQLLERYLERRDEAAFEALVSRHGPMVLGVCRRMLGDAADVEDAFQATFLVLVRRARQLGPCDAIGPWLYGVAARVALRARSQAARRRRHEPIALEYPVAAPPVSGWVDPDLGEVLDQELSRLPSKYRSPLVLCYLEGRTHEEAAQKLDWPVGTVKGRLARARDLLRSRLARRGLAPTAGALASIVSRDATAALKRPLIERTVNSSLKLVAGQSLTQVVSTSITSLVEGVLVAMILNKLKWAGLSILVAGLALTSAGVMARQDTKPKADPPPDSVKAVPNPDFEKSERKSAEFPAAKSVETASESAVDPRQELVQAVRSAYQATWEAYRAGHASAEQVHHASQKWMEAQDTDRNASVAKVAAANAHLERMRDLLRVQADRSHTPSKPAELARIKAYIAEARFLVAQAKSRPTVANVSREAGAGPGEGRGEDPKSRQIIAKLEEPISMSFANETPLDDVLKYIKQATTTPTFAGIPIYVDPQGLQDTERSLNSTIQIDLEGVPLRRTLQLILTQLGLAYFVEDGMLVITSEDLAEEPLPPAMRGSTPLAEKLQKATKGELTMDEMEELLKYLKTRETVLKHRRNVSDEPIHDKSSSGPPQGDPLIKELRELIEQLKADRQAKKAPEGK
jgi:RNA polymerase sigma factor (sigma-70 family)